MDCVTIRPCLLSGFKRKSDDREQRRVFLVTTTKLSVAEQRTQREARLMAIRLRMRIGSELDARGLVTPAAIGEALGRAAAKAQGLLTRRQWREGDVDRLRAAALWLGLPA
jgi:hypothetical protein